MTHDDLIPIGAEYLRTHKQCVYVIEDYKRKGRGEKPDVLGFDRNGVTYLIECKVSRSDFDADQKKPHKLGVRRWYLATPEVSGYIWGRLPDGWGLLESVDGVACEVLNIDEPNRISASDMAYAFRLLLRDIERKDTESNSSGLASSRKPVVRNEWRDAVEELRKAGGWWTASGWRKLNPRIFPCKAHQTRNHWKALESLGVVIDDSATEPVYAAGGVE